MSETLVWMREFVKMYGSCIFVLLFIYLLIFTGSQLMSFICNREDPHSPRTLVQRSLSLQLPLQSCYPHTSLLPPNLRASYCAKLYMDHPGPDLPASLLSSHRWKTGACLGGGTHQSNVYTEFKDSWWMKYLSYPFTFFSAQ